MFNWLRTKLGLSLDRAQAHNEYTVLFSETTNIIQRLDNLHKRMDKLESAIGFQPRVTDEQLTAILHERSKRPLKHDNLGPHYGVPE